MIDHRSRFFQRAAVLEVYGDGGCPETVVAELRLDGGRSSARRSIGFRLRQHRAGEPAGAWPISITPRYKLKALDEWITLIPFTKSELANFGVADFSLNMSR